MSNSENKWRLPHIIKIAEAYTAMADKRYKANSCTLEVFSSDFSKKYTVTIYNDGYASNDNMSYNFNILGYPIVIALMIEGKIPYNFEIASLFSGVNWTEVNKKFKRDFSASLNFVIKEVSNDKYDPNTINESILAAYRKLESIICEIQRYDSFLSFSDATISK